MRTIDIDTLQEKMKADQKSFILINALEPSFIRRFQIPDSLNLLNKEDILNRLGKEDEIVVYCSDTACNESTNLYYLLEHLGYKNVFRFPGGLMEWDRKGMALEEIYISSVA
jgi:rhodanese-related sulfurtransferase